MEIKGVTLNTLDMARVGDYLREFAGLIGDKAKPRLAGIVRGSVVLRARPIEDQNAVVRHRLKLASSNDDAPGRTHFDRITNLLNADGAKASVLDREKRVIIEFPTRKQSSAPSKEITVHDTAEIDGVVVGVEGIDDTAHLRIRDVRGELVRMQLRDMAVARDAATHFRGEPIRVRVHGTWRRTPEGDWTPLNLYVDSVHTLDQASVSELMQSLRSVPGNGWARMKVEDAQALIDEVRGGDD